MSVVLVFCIVTLIVYLIRTKYRLFMVGRKLAGPWYVPLIGNVQMITKLQPEYLFVTMSENRRKYGESFRLWLGTQLWVFLHTPEETRDALNDPTLVKADPFNQLNVLIGNGLLISHGKFWETHRRALEPAFHPNILKDFTEAIENHGNKFVKKLKLKENQTVEVSEFIFPCILDIIFDTLMSKQLNAQDDPDCIYMQAFHSVSICLFQRMVNPLLAFDFIFERTSLHGRLHTSLRVIHDLMKNVIQERAEQLLKDSTADQTELTEGSLKHRSQRTLLDTLITTNIDGRPLSFQEIRDEMNTFVLAYAVEAKTNLPQEMHCVFDAIEPKNLFNAVKFTTMIGELKCQNFAVFYMFAPWQNNEVGVWIPLQQQWDSFSMHWQEQQKLLKEINNMQPQTATDSDIASSLSRLKYLDMFIKECLRLYTIAPMTGRQSTTETKIGNKHYCAGVTLWVNMYGLAHDEAYFEQPFEFRPERFSSENHLQRPAFSYIPFSGGPHACIGRKYAWMIMKILTVQVLQNFELLLSDPNEKLVLMSQMVLKSLHGINIIFKPRW